MVVQVFTLECFRYREDKTKKLRLHKGTFENIRDSLSPCMYWTREFFAANKKEAVSKIRGVRDELNQKEGGKIYSLDL